MSHGKLFKTGELGCYVGLKKTIWAADERR